MKVKSSSSNYGSGSFIWKLDEGMGLLLGNTMSARVEQQGNCPWPGPLLHSDKISVEEVGGNNQPDL